MKKFYFKCVDVGDDLIQFRVDDLSALSKQTVAEMAAEIAYSSHGCESVWLDGEQAQLVIYDADKKCLFEAEIYITIQEPEFQASIVE